MATASSAVSNGATWQIERQGPPIEANAFEPLEVSGNLLHHHKDIGLNLAIARLILDRLGATTQLVQEKAGQMLRIDFLPNKT